MRPWVAPRQGASASGGAYGGDEDVEVGVGEVLAETSRGRLANHGARRV